jgi:ankyrin repeat protein
MLLRLWNSPPGRPQNGNPILICVAELGHADCLRLLLSVGADKNVKTMSQMTALIAAACGGHPECVRLLLEADADKEARDFCGRTALMFAARHDRPDCMRLLLDAGADKEAKDSVRGQSLLCCFLSKFSL